MIISLTNHNGEILLVDYPNVDYLFWLNWQNIPNEGAIIFYLEQLLNLELNCAKLYKGVPIMSTKFPMYHQYLQRYVWLLLKLRNQFIYNKYIDKLIEFHNKNIIIEKERDIIITESIPSKKKIVRKNQIPNKWYRAITQDLYTGEDIYIYENMRTKESFTSKDSNLLETLNAPKKKEKKIKSKVIGVPMEAMTFNFKKK